MKHTDKSVYLVSYLRSGKEALSLDDSMLIGKLALLLKSHPKTLGLAQPLMDILRAHPDFADTDRVCLASVNPLSRQLSVVDSATRPEVGENLMKPGYRCFVRPNSSLFELKEGVVRIFGDTQQVIDAFKATHQEVQRSMNYIHQMKLRSGVCLPLGSEKGLQGFFFFNSLKPGAYAKAQEGMHDILSLLSLFARSALSNSRVMGEFPVPLKIPESFPTTCTSLSQMSGVLTEIIGQLDIGHNHRVTAAAQSSPFMFSSHNFAQMFAWVAVVLGMPTADIQLSSVAKDDRVVISLGGYEDKKSSASLVSVLNNFASAYGFTFQWPANSAPFIELELDSSDSQGSRLYSI